MLVEKMNVQLNIEEKDLGKYLMQGYKEVKKVNKSYEIKEVEPIKEQLKEDKKKIK